MSLNYLFPYIIYLLLNPLWRLRLIEWWKRRLWSKQKWCEICPSTAWKWLRYVILIHKTCYSFTDSTTYLPVTMGNPTFSIYIYIYVCMCIFYIHSCLGIHRFERALNINSVKRISIQCQLQRIWIWYKQCIKKEYPFWVLWNLSLI